MKRDKFWDSLKFILIFFVVYGHIIETYTEYSSFNQAMYNFIYIFHMPFFMFTGIWLSIFFFFNFDIANILYYDTPYYKYTPEISPLVLSLSRCSEYLAAIAISFIFMRINLNKCILSQYGSSTLFIYMYHTFIILGLRSLIYENYLWQNEIIW